LYHQAATIAKFLPAAQKRAMAAGWVALRKNLVYKG
jgi:hypothetical protein